MSDQKQQVKEAVMVALAEYADAPLRLHGFIRRAFTVRYSRALPESTQSIDIGLEHSPRDNLHAAAVLYPWLTVVIPSVERVVVEMSGGDLAMTAGSASTLRQPIELVSPKGTGARWFLYQPDSVAAAVQSTVEYFQKWLLPFLDMYSSPRQLLLMDEESGDRVLHDTNQFLRVIAAAVLCNDCGVAKKLLDSKFGRPAMRRRYAAVFDYVEKEARRPLSS